jgi:ribose-phosphate pyrophosphokinase
VEALELIGEVEGKNVLIVDDITETAGTLKTAAALLKERGAQRIFAGVSHAVLNDQGRQRLKESAIEEVITTDSTPFATGDNVSVVSVAELMGEGIRRIHHDESVTSLFDIS